MKITDFFNPYNIEHIQAYKILQDIGSWPENFLPKNIKMSINWHLMLLGMFAEAWIEQAMAGHILGMPKL